MCKKSYTDSPVQALRPPRPKIERSKNAFKKSLRLDFRVGRSIALPDVGATRAAGLTRALAQEVPRREFGSSTAQSHGHCIDFGFVFVRYSYQRFFIARAPVHLALAGGAGSPNLDGKEGRLGDLLHLCLASLQQSTFHPFKARTTLRAANSNAAARIPSHWAYT